MHKVKQEPDPNRGPESNREWLVEVFAPKSVFPVPDWTRRLLLDLALMCSPTETWRTPKKLQTDKREQGAAAGHFFATVQCLRLRWETLTENQQGLATGLLARVREWVSKALDAPPSEAKAFFSGFANALNKGLFDQQGEPTSRRGDGITYQIKWTLVNEWDEIEKLRLAEVGTPALTKFLLTKLPAHLSEGYERNPALSRAFQKRVEKICERCGLSMGRRGAPKKRNSPA